MPDGICPIAACSIVAAARFIADGSPGMPIAAAALPAGISAGRLGEAGFIDIPLGILVKLPPGGIAAGPPAAFGGVNVAVMLAGATEFVGLLPAGVAR